MLVILSWNKINDKVTNKPKNMVFHDSWNFWHHTYV